MATKRPKSKSRRARLTWSVGLVLSLVALWALTRPRTEVEQTRRHFVELQWQIGIARENQRSRASDRDRATPTSQTTGADGTQTVALNAAAVESSQLWRDVATVRRAVLSTPLVTFPGPSPVSGVVPVHATNSRGCAACHLSVATAGFETFPEPFRTHSSLKAYVGAESPHPPSRVECVSCHLGEGGATSFAAAGHSTLRVPVRLGEVAQPGTDRAGRSGVRSVAVREWTDVGAAGATLPIGRTEAVCVTCHAGERYQPAAPALNEALVSLDRGGCYACHDVPGMERTPKRGPDLRRIKGKLTPEWVSQWLAEPRAMKPATWMPSFWPDRRALRADDRAEIEAVVAYLFANAEDYVPAVPSPPRGDAANGQRIVDSVGCLACHVVGAADRDEVSQRRTFAPPLQGIGNKTTYPWLFDWVRDPARYGPGTRMPNLRLTSVEAADVATYLTMLISAPPGGAAAPLPDDESYRKIVHRYVTQGATAPDNVGRLSGVDLRAAAGRTVIQVRGCFNCHEIRGFEGQRTRVPMPDSRDWSLRRVSHVARRAADTTASDLSRGDAEFRSKTDRAVVEPVYLLGSHEFDRVALALAASAWPQRSTRSMSMRATRRPRSWAG